MVEYIVSSDGQAAVAMVLSLVEIILDPARKQRTPFYDHFSLSPCNAADLLNCNEITIVGVKAS